MKTTALTFALIATLAPRLLLAGPRDARLLGIAADGSIRLSGDTVCRPLVVDREGLVRGRPECRVAGKRPGTFRKPGPGVTTLRGAPMMGRVVFLDEGGKPLPREEPGSLLDAPGGARSIDPRLEVVLGGAGDARLLEWSRGPSLRESGAIHGSGDFVVVAYRFLDDRLGRTVWSAASFDVSARWAALAPRPDAPVGGSAPLADTHPKSADPPSDQPDPSRLVCDAACRWEERCERRDRQCARRCAEVPLRSPPVWRLTWAEKMAACLGKAGCKEADAGRCIEAGDRRSRSAATCVRTQAGTDWLRLCGALDGLTKTIDDKTDACLRDGGSFEKCAPPLDWRR